MKFFKNKAASVAPFAVLSCLMALDAHAVTKEVRDHTHGLNADALIGADLISGGPGNTSSSTSALGYGFRLGYHLNYNWEVGLSVSTSSNSTTAAGSTTSSATTLLMAELDYHLSDGLNPLYFGFRMGAGFSSVSGNAVTASASSNAAYGFVGGYDVYTNDNFTIGPRVAYTMVPISGGNIGVFQIQAAFKYFF